MAFGPLASRALWYTFRQRRPTQAQFMIDVRASARRFCAIIEQSASALRVNTCDPAINTG
jgi:hypothetical protein